MIFFCEFSIPFLIYSENEIQYSIELDFTNQLYPAYSEILVIGGKDVQDSVRIPQNRQR